MAVKSTFTAEKVREKANTEIGSIRVKLAEAAKKANSMLHVKTELAQRQAAQRSAKVRRERSDI